MKRPTTLPMGEISSGTLRPEDVVPEFFSLADEVKMSREDRNKVRRLSAEWDKASPLLYEDRSPNEVEAFDETWNELVDILKAYAPPFCYVGSLEGDGACIGVWLSQDSLDEAIHDSNVWKDPDDGSTIPTEMDYRLVVSDHGNLTLYDRKGRELWGVV